VSVLLLLLLVLFRSSCIVLTHADPARWLRNAIWQGRLPAGKVEALLDALTDGMHVVASERSASNDLAVDEAFLRRALERARFDAASAEALLGARGSDAIKKKLSDNTKEAVEAGAYGSPTMLITPPVGKGEPFLVFGSDRFEQIAFITGKPYHGPVPPGSKL
jgi:2-hydroxychromene-2-carboxylate isomerase